MSDVINAQNRAKMTDPLVTIGLPVYNGGNQLREALESLCAQDHPNLEILISDNASTDGTAEMCAEFVARDHRIRYHREATNRGATWNFNRVLDLRQGGYFLWAAHDDLWSPTFISKAVAALEADPSASICHSYGQPFTSAGLYVGDAYVGWVNEHETAEGRYRQLLEHWDLNAAIYGLHRSTALDRTRGLRLTLCSDLVFVAEMCLQGKIIQVPEVLQFKRYHERYRTHQEMLRYLGCSNAKPRHRVALRLRVSWHCVGVVLRSERPRRSRASMIADTLAVYFRRDYWLIDLKEGVAALIGPERFGRLRDWRNR